MFFGSIQADSRALTTAESNQIKEWANSISVEDGVGQLFMINIPLHFSRIQERNAIHKRLIEEEGFGSIILQSSNFNYLRKRTESGEERISIVTNFVSNMQYRALASKHLKAPLFIAADFEGPRYNPIKSVITPPPPALTMATTQDINDIENTGKAVGYQLASSGINMILGPVLDIDETVQGAYNSLLKNRSFSSLPEGVSRIAAYYIKGLREAGITVIGKHFPGLGKININPHAGVSKFIGTKDDFKRQMMPYYDLKDYLNGIMTSHVVIDFLDDKNPATVSKKVAGLIRSRDNTALGIHSLDYNDKIVITDDMGMGSILEYAKSRSQIGDTSIENGYYSSIDFGALAIDAFDAGHDILMFAKVILDSQRSNYTGEFKHGVITVDEIIRVKDRLASYISSSNDIEKRFRESLRRILQAKAYSYKLNGGKINHFIKGKMKKVVSNRVNPPEIIKSDDGYIDSLKVEALHQKTIIDAYVLLQGEVPRITRVNQSSACIFTHHAKNYLALQTKYNRLHLSDSAHLRLNIKENETIIDYLKRLQQPIKDFLGANNCQHIYFEANKKEDMDRLQNIIQYADSEAAIYILLHQTPIIIPEKIYNNKKVNIMGAFTSHALSYPIDVQVLNGNIIPQENYALTIPFKQKRASINIDKPASGVPVFQYEIDTATELATELVILELQEKFQKLKVNFSYFKKNIKSLPQELSSSLSNHFKGKEVTIDRLAPPAIEQVKIFDDIISADKLNSITSMKRLLSEISTDIEQRNDLNLLEKTRYKLLSFLSIRQKNAGGLDTDIYKNNYGYYTHLLLILMSITTLLVLLYIIEFSKQDIIKSASFKGAVLILIKRVFTRPQLLFIIALLSFMIVLLIARIRELPVEMLLAAYFK
ncbi:MAG: glycoside hydrolase family 3 protein [Cocleimonas sp.]|nr:glycoside hydrolase family 3 protein [Cocleimonas sp.]